MYSSETTDLSYGTRMFWDLTINLIVDYIITDLLRGLCGISGSYRHTKRLSVEKTDI